MAAPSRVNYVRHVNAFFRLVKHDDRLQSNDVSLYMALFQIWNMNNFSHIFPVLREEVINLSCIGSRSTYMSCMKRLHVCGYIIYREPEQKYAPCKISIISLTEQHKSTNATQLSLFHESNDNIGPGTRPGIGPGTGPKVGPQRGPIPGRNNNKHTNGNKGEKKKSHPQTKKNEKEEKQKETAYAPEITHVQEYFQTTNQPDTEAKKFFYHYQAIGWKLSGAQIINWQAAAAKWIENITPLKKTKNDRGIKPGRLNVEENKGYNNPL